MESVMAGVEYFLRYQSLSLWALLFTILIGFVGILLWHVHNLKLQQISISLDVLDVDLSTKVFAVTGASSGLGAAITKELYRRNAIVLMLASKWSNAVEGCIV
ncbi:hypothetical protein KIN20_026913 [Parelaphostrongylus tenuis]|uniref:Uncharacterized protein n=1 Tax=Parelaphostrongylus tenuis TaxID=148309 RepID=A0AAD5QYP3_PARTN|nr:hypothetical protein KIN20_026913 [Parelaphostrongylus tenuis]